MRSTVTVRMLILFMVAALGLAACARATPEPVTHTIEMNEYTFTPTTLEVKVGQPVTIEVVNNGALEHELMFGRQVKMMDSKPAGYQHDMFAEAGVKPKVINQGTVASENPGAHVEMGEHDAGHSGFMVTLPRVGDRATITFTPNQDMLGEWEIGCFMQDGVHYTAGMTGKLVVTR